MPTQEEKNARHEAWLEEKRKNGICILCPEKADPGYKTCKFHREERTRILKERSEKWIAQGRCRRCGSVRESHHAVCDKCLEKYREHEKKRKEKRKASTVCCRCKKEKDPGDNRILCSDCREKYKNKSKEYRDGVKNMVFSAYGNKCACCGEDNQKFLSIDHIHNDGCHHRKITGIGLGYNFYNWLIKNDFPKDRFQLLCFNCNFGKNINGGVCPHKDAK